MAVVMNLRGTSLDTFGIGRDKATLDASGLAQARTLSLPDADGTLALSGSQDWGLITDPPDAAIPTVEASAGPAAQNLIINGGCRVSHRGEKTLTTAWQYGPVDLIAVKATSTVSNGSIVQQWVETLGSTGYALRLKDVTMPGPGAQLQFRVRIEARDARHLKDQAAVFSCAAHHDHGVIGGGPGDRDVDWTITVNKADAADDFSAVTQIATGTTSIPPTVNNTLELAITDMGDCSNGIEVLITVDTLESNLNTLHIADLQLEKGATKSAFQHRPVSEEIALVHRYLRPCAGLVGIANSASVMHVTLNHPDLRAAPGASGYEQTGTISMTDAVTADFHQSSENIFQVFESSADKARLGLGNFSGLSSGKVMIQLGSGGVILASAEL